MADRFPSIEEFSGGNSYFLWWPVRNSQILGATEARDESALSLDPTASGDDFLSREKAALGDDANQFVTPHDNLAVVEDVADDDLLGGSTSAGKDLGGMTDFESSFPAISSHNEVSGIPKLPKYSVRN